MDTETIRQARCNMIATLNSFRDTLEDLGNGVADGQMAPDLTT